MEVQAIKPCPFCGARGIIKLTDSGKFNSIEYYHGECTKCGAKTKSYPSEIVALNAWNRRVER